MSAAPCAKQGQLEQAAQDCFWLGFEYLQAQRPHSLSGQPVPVFDHPHCKKNHGVFVHRHESQSSPLHSLIPESMQVSKYWGLKGKRNMYLAPYFLANNRGDVYHVPGADPERWQQGSAQTRERSSTEQTGLCDTSAFQKPRYCLQTAPEEQTKLD